MDGSRCGRRSARAAALAGSGRPRRARLPACFPPAPVVSRRWFHSLRVSVLAPLAFAACGGEPAARGAASAPGVSASPAGRGGAGSAESDDAAERFAAGGEVYTGVVVREREIRIPAPFDGRLEESLAMPGQSVAAGAVLGRFDTDASERQVSSARASVAEADAALHAAQVEAEQATGRYGRRLERPDLFSEEQMEDIRAEVEIAEARLHAAEARLSQTQSALSDAEAELARATLRSPLTGVVSEVHGPPGAYYTRGATVFAVGAGEWRIRFAAPTDAAEFLLPGDPLWVRTEGHAVQPGVVLAVSPVIDARTLLVFVEAALCGERLPSGLPARISVPRRRTIADERFAGCRAAHPEVFPATDDSP